MTARKYSKAVERAGGVNKVAELLDCGRDKILRRCNGTNKVSAEALLAVEALPTVEHWQVMSRLKRDPEFRRKFKRRAKRMEEGPERTVAVDMLASTFNGYRALAGGKKKWAKQTTDGAKAGAV